MRLTIAAYDAIPLYNQDLQDQGFPIAVTMALEYGSFAAVGLMMGTLGTTQIAAHQVALNLASVIGQRLQVFQAMWLREMQRAVDVFRKVLATSTSTATDTSTATSTSTRSFRASRP